jgi:hypothetical protein
MEEDLTFRGSAHPQVLKTNRVSAHILEILGTSPLLGRSLTATEKTAVISYDLWQREFHGDLQLLGRTIDVGGNAYSIAGVLPQNFSFPQPGIDVWLANPEDSPQCPPPSRALSPFLSVFGRLRPGVTLQQPTAEQLLRSPSRGAEHSPSAIGRECNELP